MQMSVQFSFFIGVQITTAETNRAFKVP